MIILLLCLLASSSAPEVEFDLLLKGGHLIDAGNGISGLRDVAIAGGRIAAVEQGIDPARAHKVVDVSSLYVIPGLVDLHVHVDAGTGAEGVWAGDLSVYPDGHTFRSGVTTVVDAGTTGWRHFLDFKTRVIDRAQTRVLAMLNIVGSGMMERPLEQNVHDMDPEATARMARAYPDIVVGIKTAHYEGPEWVAVERAVEAGTLAGLPVMVDFGTFRPERPYQDLVLKKLRPGDISTHAFRPQVPVLDEQGKILPYLFEARKRGIFFDVGHGAGSFLFRQAVPAVRQGFPPDSISTDLHVLSMNAGMKDLLNVMSKFLNMGIPLDEVVARSTSNPARMLRRQDLGHLSAGAPADVAVVRRMEGDFGYVDVYGARLTGSHKLICELTLRGGLVVWDLNGISRENWDKLGDYESQGDERWDGTIVRSP